MKSQMFGRRGEMKSYLHVVGNRHDGVARRHKGCLRHGLSASQSVNVFIPAAAFSFYRMIEGRGALNRDRG